MRPALVALLVGLGGLGGLAGGPADPVAASCVGPQVEVPGAPVVRGHPVLVRGSEVTVTGTFFHDGCDDTGTGSAGPGCSAPDDDSEESPMRQVELRLGSTVVGTADATGERSTVSWTFTVPDTLPAGLVRLEAGPSRQGQVLIR